MYFIEGRKKLTVRKKRNRLMCDNHIIIFQYKIMIR